MKFSNLTRVIPILILAMHFTFSVLYLAPYNPLTVYYRTLISSYIEPLFTQNWALFAPEPATSMVELHVRCGTNGEWQPWVDPFKNILTEHQRWRLFYHGRLFYLMYGPIRQFHNDIIANLAPKNNSLKKNIPDLSSYQPILRLVRQTCLTMISKNAPPGYRAQFRLWQKFAPQFSSVTSGQLAKSNVKLIYQSPPFIS